MDTPDNGDVVEVFADVVCPFAYVGLTRLLEERDRRGLATRLRVRAWPLEIVNGEPHDADAFAAEVDDVRRQVAPDLFAGFDARSFPATSLPALALTAAAYHQDDAAGEAVAMELRRELFECGRDIASAAVLASIAERWDLPADADQAAVHAEHAEGVRRGVQGSPHFFVGGYSSFCPVLRIAKQGDGHLDVHVDRAAYDDLIQHCFGTPP